MTMNRVLQQRLFALAVTLSLCVCAGLARAAEPTDAVAVETQRARNGGGILISTWQPEKAAGVENSGMVAFLGYFEKGLDLHLAWQNTLGYWRRNTTWSESAPLTGTTTHELQTHLVPTLTSLKLYPFTTPADRVEPYMNAGVGVVLGLQDEKITDAVSTSSSGMTMHTGLGLRAGVGADLRANEAFGVSLGGHFESASFGQEKPGERLYKGFGVDIGLTYRFQYR